MSSRDLDDLRALAGEHGGVPAFVPCGEGFEGVVLTIGLMPGMPGMTGFLLDGEVVFAVGNGELLNLLSVPAE